MPPCRSRCSLFAAYVACTVVNSATLLPDPVLPTDVQRRYMGWGLEMFAHFSITTFTGSQSGDQDPAKFTPNPATLNISQWVATAKDMGAAVLVLTSKHEAGFCLWPSKFSNYTIAASHTVGHRDFVREFVDACREQGVLPGLYFTTGAWQPSGKYGTNFTEYNINQMTELVTQYGDIAYWWFDHHSNDPIHVAVDDLVRKHQPNSAMLGPDSWLTGQETGFATYPLWYACNTTDGTDHARCTPPGQPYGHQFKSWESDCSFFNDCHPWFCGDSCPKPQSLELTMNHWESTFGRGVNYILNIPPSRNGLMDDDLVLAAREFRAERERRYSGKAFLGSAATTATSGKATVTLKEVGVLKFDRVLLAEETLFSLGQRVANYKLEALLENGTWVALQLNDAATCKPHVPSRCGGLTIGSHKIDIITPPVAASAVRLVLGDVLPHSGSVGLPVVSVKVFSSSAPGPSPSPPGPSPPGPVYCKSGLFDDSHKVCCPRGCGKCGGESGSGCESRPGGSAQCCTDGIIASGSVCSDPNDVSCIVPGFMLAFV